MKLKNFKSIFCLGIMAIFMSGFSGCDNESEGLISSGGFFSCGLTSDRGVKCWGYGKTGQLGDGEAQGTSAPVDVLAGEGSVERLTDAIQITTGKYHACALIAPWYRPHGSVKCWGLGKDGQIGLGQQALALTPVDVLVDSESGELLDQVVQVSAGYRHTCALSYFGTVKCWGARKFVGDGVHERGFYDPVDVVAGPGSSELLSGVVQIDSGHDRTCALLSTGGVTCWGPTWRSGNPASIGTLEAVEVLDNETSGPLSGVLQVSVGGNHACALLNSKKVKCWGRRAQLGNHTLSGPNFLSSYGAVSVLESEDSEEPLADVFQISAGYHHTCAIMEGSSGVKCWGSGSYGQLGDGDTKYQVTPVDVVASQETPDVPLGRAAEVSAGYYHTCVVSYWGPVSLLGLWKLWTNGEQLESSHPSLPSSCS